MTHLHCGDSRNGSVFQWAWCAQQKFALAFFLNVHTIKHLVPEDNTVEEHGCRRLRKWFVSFMINVSPSGHFHLNVFPFPCYVHVHVMFILLYAFYIQGKKEPLFAPYINMTYHYILLWTCHMPSHVACHQSYQFHLHSGSSYMYCRISIPLLTSTPILGSIRITLFYNHIIKLHEFRCIKTLFSTFYVMGCHNICSFNLFFF